MSDTPGKKIGMLKNDNLTETVPKTGWKYSDGSGACNDDPALVVSAGPLETLCDKITIVNNGHNSISWPGIDSNLKIMYKDTGCPKIIHNLNYFQS